MKVFGKRHLKVILWYVFFWLFAIYFLILIRFIGHAGMIFNPVAPEAPIDISVFWRMGLVGALLMGIAFGFLEILFEKRIFRVMGYGKLILVKSVIYVFIFVLILAYLSLRNLHLSFGYIDFYTWRASFFDLNLLIPVSYMAVAGIILNFIKEISLKFGQGILWKMLIGKFHRPKEEERILMFLDLRSSTTIAEKLGHIKYSELIQDCFNDLSIVRKQDAEIYQYVGDEAVLSWTVKSGLDNNNCLHAFYAFKDVLQQRTKHYQKKYGLTPFFKAGMNMGKVTVAEVGQIKKEIAFHGDTVNTAARIQGKCNELDSELLISESLEKQVNGTHFKREIMGRVALKGKQKEINIYAVTRP
ncbi:adenylate/guanylate cyclase domain-containing protein [uncultured Croceitalea sp.]|uniref:adenylate/guanylate cyclase domain-containing protein n=1 Tax=uncultured Croceitalea sp. TaxID=1798908 RepID=UPI003305E430